MWECFSLPSPLNNLENRRKVFAFAGWAFIWLSRRPKSLFALEQQSFKITHCIKIFSCRCSLLPMTFTQHFNGMQGPLKCRQFSIGSVRLQTRQSNVTSQERMWYQLLGCLEVDRDAVECNVHIQQLDWAPNVKTCPRKAFAVLLTAISSQMLDLHEGIITLRNSETSGKWDQECNFGCFWLIHWERFLWVCLWGLLWVWDNYSYLLLPSTGHWVVVLDHRDLTYLLLHLSALSLPHCFNCFTASQQCQVTARQLLACSKGQNPKLFHFENWRWNHCVVIMLKVWC